MNIETIFFDVGETLLKVSSISKSKRTILQKYLSCSTEKINTIVDKWGHLTNEYYNKNRECDFHSIKEISHLCLQKTLEKQKIRLTKKNIFTIVSSVWDDFVDHSILYPDVQKSLKKLILQRYQLGLITDSDRDIVEGILRKHNLSKLFTFVVVSSDLNVYKPNPKIFEHSMELTGNQPQEILYVGDSGIDLKGATTIGFFTAIIHRRRFLDYPDSNIKPDFEISDLSQLHEKILDYKKDE